MIILFRFWPDIWHNTHNQPCDNDSNKENIISVPYYGNFYLVNFLQSEGHYQCYCTTQCTFLENLPIHPSCVCQINAYALKTPHVVFLPIAFLSVFFGRLSEINWMSQYTFLTSWPWHLTYDLQTWPRYPPTWLPCQNSSLYVFRKVSIGCYSETDRHTHTHDVKTITSITSETWGVISHCWKRQLASWGYQHISQRDITLSSPRMCNNSGSVPMHNAVVVNKRQYSI